MWFIGLCLLAWAFFGFFGWYGLAFAGGCFILMCCVAD